MNGKYCSKWLRPAILGMLGVVALSGQGWGWSLGSLDGAISAGGSAWKAATLSDKDVKELSDRACAEVDQQSKIAPPNSKYTVRLQKIMKGMPSEINGHKLQYKVYMTRDINAWAMGNGCVRVYSALMDMMTDDEIRGVIGHEIGHVALGHSKKAMQTAYAATAARQVASASGNSIATSINSSQLGDLSEKFINAQFSQKQESAADDYSFDLLTKSGFKREGLVTAFQKLAKMGDSSSMLNSHPASSARAKHIQDRIDKNK
ncbi:MAG: M48 family metallopeptidase [Desulfuromonadales bacterium]|nr:M48 family metallopeptidase [Desulfuromonadales bacterium]